MQNNVKNTTFPSIFDLIAPHSCRGCGRTGSPLCNRCKNYILKHHQYYCPNCKAKNLNGKCQKCSDLPLIFIIDKKDSLLGELIYDYKFSSNRSLAKTFAEILDHLLPKIDGEVSIVPLPTNTKHIRSRGLDHTLLIAKNLKNLRGKNYHVEKILLRNKNTIQVGANEEKRLLQANQAYIINPKTKIDQNTTYLLLDDIWTTGASMQSALKKLRDTGASKIILSVLAVNRLD